MTTYEIVTRHSSEEEWTNDGIESSPGSNEFATEEEAEAAIGELKELGPDWAEAEYDVRQVEDEAEDIDDCYVMTCTSGAVVLVSAESAEQAEEAWDADDDAEKRVTSARPATHEDVESCVDSGHDYR